MKICLTQGKIYSPILLLLNHSLGLICMSLQLANYEKELEEMKMMTKQEFVASLRRYACLCLCLCLCLQLLCMISLNLTNNSSLFKESYNRRPE